MHTQRIHFLDLLRGFAVVVMVLGHSIDAVLGMEARTTDLFRVYDAVRGFTAPVFLFVSGLAFTFATEKRWEEYRVVGRTTVKRVLRLTGLLLIGYALHAPFFSLGKLLRGATPAESEAFFQADVLHCLAVSLLMLQGLVLLSRTPRAFARVAASVGFALVVIAPLIWEIDFAPVVSPALAPYFNQQQISIFPLFPFAAFLVAGAVTGRLFLSARAAGKEKEFFDRMLAGSVLAAAVGLLFDLLPFRLLPPHDYWKASPWFFLIRLGVVLLLTASVAYVRRVPPLMTRHVVVLGQASLLVYVVHLVLVYGSAVNQGLAQILGRNLSALQAIGIGTVVLLAMLLLVHLWKTVRERHGMPVRIAGAALAGALLVLFIASPY